MHTRVSHAPGFGMMLVILSVGHVMQRVLYLHRYMAVCAGPGRMVLPWVFSIYAGARFVHGHGRERALSALALQGQPFGGGGGELLASCLHELPSCIALPSTLLHTKYIQGPTDPPATPPQALSRADWEGLSGNLNIPMPSSALWSPLKHVSMPPHASIADAHCSTFRKSYFRTSCGWG